MHNELEEKKWRRSGLSRKYRTGGNYLAHLLRNANTVNAGCLFIATPPIAFSKFLYFLTSADYETTCSSVLDRTIKYVIKYFLWWYFQHCLPHFNNLLTSKITIYKVLIFLMFNTNCLVPNLLCHYSRYVFIRNISHCH